jgi:hypothetical protein
MMLIHVGICMSLSMQKCFKRRNWEIWELWSHLFDSVQVCEATEVNEGDGLRRQGWQGRSRFTAHHGARWCRFACGDGKGAWLWHVAVCHLMSPLRHTHTHTIFKINFDQIWSDLIIFVLSTIFTMQPPLYVMIVMKDKHDMKFDLMATIWDDLIDLQWHTWTNMDKAFLHFSSHVIMMSSWCHHVFSPRFLHVCVRSWPPWHTWTLNWLRWLYGLEKVSPAAKKRPMPVSKKFQEVPSCCRIVGIHWFCWNHDGKSNEKSWKLGVNFMNKAWMPSTYQIGPADVIQSHRMIYYIYYKMQKRWHVTCNIVQQVCLLWPFWRSWDCAASCSAVFGKMLSTARWAGDVFSKLCRLPKTMQNSYSDDGDDGQQNDFILRISSLWLMFLPYSPCYPVLSCFISRCVCRHQGRFPRPLPHSSWSGFSIQPTQCA